MKIRTRIRIAGALVICILLAYGAMLLYLDRTMSQLVEEVKKSNEIVNNISVLRNLTQDYLLFHTERAQRQWSAVYDEVLRLLDQWEYRLLNSEYGIGDAPQKLKLVGDTFARLMSLQTAAQPDNLEKEARGELQNRLTTQLLLATQDLLSRFLNLNEEMHQKLVKFERLSSILDILALSLLGILLLSNAVFLQRVVVKPVLNLHAGAEIIGAGNLNYQVATTSKDEIGELSRAFDRMTANLKETTVSRDELAREMAERRRVEAALRESEERLRLFIEHAPASLAMFDREMRYLSVSRRWLEDYGLGECDLRGRSHYEVFPEISREWKEVHQRGLAGEVIQSESDRFTRTDGSVQWVRWEVRPWYGPSAEVDGIVIFTEDVTGQKRAEEALRESESRFRKVFEHSPMGIAITDWQGRFQQGNPAYCHLVGYTEEELRQLEFAALIHPEDRDKNLEQIQKLRAGELPFFEIENRYLRKDGQTVWVHKFVSILPDSTGKPAQIVALVTGVTERRRAEEALRESRQQAAFLADLLESASQPFGVGAPHGGIITCNTAYARLLGYTKEEFLALDWARGLTPPEWQDIEQAKLAELHQTGQPVRYEKEYWHKDGHRLPVELLVNIRRDDQGQLLYYYAFITDISERQRAQAELAETLRQKEEALARSEHLASFPQLNPNPVLEFDTQGGITYANPAAEKFLEQLAPNISWRDFLPADWEEMQQANRERGEHTFRREVRIKDRVFHAAIHFSESFKVWRFYAIDISQRLLAEAALRESEARFRSLFENMAEGVVVHELIYGDGGPAVDYRIVSANPAFEKHTGLPAAAIQGQLASRAYGLDEAPYLEVYARVAQTGEPTTFETFFPPLQRYFHISVTSPKKDYFVTVFEDITARRQMEERLRAQTSELTQAVSDLEETNAELERFMYMISHDLKSPLVTIATFLGFLEEDLGRGDAGRIDKDLLYIRTAADKMGQLLSELLEMSRIGRVVNPPVEVSFQEVAQEALQAVAGPIAGRGLTVQVGKEDVTLFGDRPRLVEIWQNLVENAVKYLGEQPVPRLTIGLERQGEATVFFVGDNGIGIDPRYHDKIFGIFEKLDPKSGGTGIGLAIVKRIVELYQGRIWVESAGLGQGSCFRFTLPGAIR